MMLYFISIDDITWNRIVTISGVLVLIIFILINNRQLKKWYKKTFRKIEISTHYRINQAIHADMFSFQASLVLNADGVIVGANKKTQVLFGWHEEELIGSKMDKLLVPESLEKFETHKKQHSSHRYLLNSEVKNVITASDEIVETEVNAMTRIGEEKILRVMTGKWTDDVDIYFTVTMLDITHRVRNQEAIKVAEKEIAEMRQLYHEGEKVGNVAFWKLDTKTGKLLYSANFAHLYAIKGAEVFVEQLIKRVHVDDRVRVAETMRRAKDTQTGYEMEYRLIGLDGYLYTIQSVASAVKVRNQLAYFIGMARLIKFEKPEWL